MNINKYLLIKKAVENVVERNAAVDNYNNVYRESLRNDMRGLPVPGYGYFAEDNPQVQYQENSTYAGGLPQAYNNNITSGPQRNGWNWTQPARASDEKAWSQYYNRLSSDKVYGPNQNQYQIAGDQLANMQQQAAMKALPYLNVNRQYANNR